MMGRATTRANRAAAQPATGMVRKMGQWYMVFRMAVLYAPTAKKAACPIWKMPACPRMTLSERASRAYRPMLTHTSVQ